jgi:fused signal recognition particle receptor
LPAGRIDDATLDELETRLVSADVGLETSTAILDGLRGKVARRELGDIDALLAALRASMLDILRPVGRALSIDRTKRPFVILVVGVNGSGKTTTIGKLARRLRDDGLKVMLAAGDTFRAAAIEQLEIWGDRNRRARDRAGGGRGPGGRDLRRDAGRSGARHGRADRGHGGPAPYADQSDGRAAQGAARARPARSGRTHEVLLVLDAGQGQNALAQARQFHEALGVTGIVLTKLDGTAKGGIVLAIADRLRIPIRFLGVGEDAQDFDEFDPGSFVDAVLETPHGAPATA